MTEMVQASTEFVKAGYTEEESAQLAKTASLFQNIADSELSASDASAVIIANMKAFNMTAQDSTKIIDVINQISNVFAVSSSDLSAGLSKTASAMSTLGNTYTESVALMVGAGEQMPNQSGKIARGLRSIGLEMVKTAQESKTLNTGYKDVTLSLYDQDDALKSTYQIMADLYPTWQKMTDQQKANLGITLAGKQQYEVFSATMEGFGQVLKANEVALSSQGSAIKENEAYMESIEARTKKLQSQFDLLVNGDDGLNALIKGLLDTSTGILKFIDDTNALNLVLLATGAILTVNLLPTLLSTGASLLSTATTVLPRAISAWRLYSLGLAEANMAMSASIPIIGLVVAALGVMYMAYQKAESARKEHIQSTKDEIENLKSLSTQINEATTREQLNSIVESNLAQYQKEIDKISDLNKARQFLINKIKDEQTERSKDLIGSQYTDVQDALSTTKAPSNKSTYGADNLSDVITGRASFNFADSENINTKAQYIEALTKERDAYIELADGSSIYNNQIEKLNNAISNNQSELDSANKTLSEYEDALNQNGQILDGNSGKVRNMTTLEHQAYETKKNNISVSKEYKDALLDEEEATATYLETLAEEYDILRDATSDVVGGIDSLNSALAEQNEQGALSTETVLKLIDDGYALALSYDAQTGAVTLDKDAMLELAQARIADQQATILQEQTNIIEKLIAEGQVVANLANGYILLSKSRNESTLDFVQRTGGSGTSNEQTDTYNSLQAQNKALDELQQQLKDYGNGAPTGFGKVSDSSKKATDALKDQKDALNDLKSQYDSTIDYIVSKYDDEIDAIEKAKKVALDAVDARIKAKNREKDNELNAIDDEINALESERDAREAYWDSVINGLKKVNTERERALALQQAQEDVTSAKSKKVMIFKDKSFGYGINESEVASAEQNLSDLQEDQKYETQIEKLEALKSAELANYESRLNSLNSHKDSVSASYDEQISNLESYKESVEANYDAQIAYYEMYKEQFIEMTEQYQVSQDGLMASQLTGIDLENNHWMTRLENLNKFVSSYNSLLNGIGSSSSIDTSSVQASWKARGYANGISSVPSNQMAVIGDNPSNSELVIGGKLNGVATKLERGSRVVNSTDTRNLLGGLSSMLGYNGLNGQTVGTVSNNNTSTKGVVNNIVVNASVADGEGLVDYLQSYANQMTQKAYAN